MPAELAHAAAVQGMPAIALTDHNGLSGAIEFYDDCQALGVHPVLGLELDVAIPAEHLPAAVTGTSGVLVFLATQLSGWGSLCRLSSLANAAPGSSPRESVTLAQVAENASGLICLTGGRRGLAAWLTRQAKKQAALAWLSSLAELFPGRLYAELQLHTDEDAAWVARLAALAGRLHLPTVATHDIHYLAPEQNDLQRTVTAVRLNIPRDELPEDAPAPPNSHFPSSADMAARFSHYPQALANTLEIADRCRLELPLGVPHFPAIDLPPGMTAIQELRQKAESGLRRRYAEVTRELQQRLDHEIEVIEGLGYTTLFLVMEEIIQFAHRSGIPISSRGSAASSLVSHCLGITTPDPVRLNLYFERFLNPARATPPDIDTDICSRRRDDLIHHVYQQYGKDRVAMVCTVNRFRRRSALRDVAKAYGLPQAEINAMAENLPHRWYGPPVAETDTDDPYAELTDRFATAHHLAVFRDAAALIGLPRHLSIHPGGLVIAPGEMTDLAPTQMATKGVLISQFDLDSIERLGLVKIDLLGIRGLTVLGDVAAPIQARDPATYPSILDVLETIPQKDALTTTLVQHGRTIGCFQIESLGMRTTLKEIRATNVDDIMVALALYRPGPLTGGLKDAFVRRHRGVEPISHLHPALAPLLDDTYGVILYQEQVLRIAHDLAGLSLGDADLLRRAMSHFDPGKEMQTLKEKFVHGAYMRSAVPEATAEKVWDLMAAFAGYGFPKAHAASYAQVAWRSAWCKAHYPAIFIAAVMANWGGYYGQRVYLTEARRLGLTLRPPHINYAQPEFSVSYLDNQPVLFMGLNQVRELTRRTQHAILHQRPFHSLVDFLVRVDPRPAEAQNLVGCGALEGLGSIPELLKQLDSGSWRGGQLPLFSLSSRIDEWPLEKRASAQQAILGASLDAHPLELHSVGIAAAQAETTIDAASQVGKRVRVAGMRQSWRRSNTRRGDYIYFMALEDLEGQLDVIIAADVYRRSHSELKGDGPFVVEGNVEIDPNTAEPMIRAEKIWGLD